MTIFQAIMLGVVQGITEFLPISSTAHLTLAGKLMGMIDLAQPEQWTASIAVIQLGTLAAVLIYFWRDVFQMFSSLFTDFAQRSRQGFAWSEPSKLAGKIVVGTIPVVIVGLSLKKIIEGVLTKEISVIATSMIGLAIILYWAEKSSRHERVIGQTTWKDALGIGIGQCFALIPGSSRSGTTITAALFLGLKREAAARFSFLLSIPAVFASGLLELYESRKFIQHDQAVMLAVATIISGIVGYAAIAFLLRYLKNHSTFVFIWYRLIVGILLWGLLIGKIIS